MGQGLPWRPRGRPDRRRLASRTETISFRSFGPQPVVLRPPALGEGADGLRINAGDMRKRKAPPAPPAPWVLPVSAWSRSSALPGKLEATEVSLTTSIEKCILYGLADRKVLLRGQEGRVCPDSLPRAEGGSSDAGQAAGPHSRSRRRGLGAHRGQALRRALRRAAPAVCPVRQADPRTRLPLDIGGAAGRAGLLLGPFGFSSAGAFGARGLSSGPAGLSHRELSSPVSRGRPAASATRPGGELQRLFWRRPAGVSP